MASKILIFFVLIETGFSIKNPIVDLPNGRIQGREGTTTENKEYYIFEKIPYAEPPLGKLRFQAPVPPKAWNGTLNTTYINVACYQMNANTVPTSEDCLYLNVYTPMLSTKSNFPVMVYIHGGGFMNGYSFAYYPDLFVDNDVILVTVNYRLGIFGFLSTGDEIISGNSGLKDQLLALQWIHDNIKLFGGDSSRVLIFGQSTGAASCAYHLLNQNSEGLFSRAILESGTCLNQVAFQRNPRSIAFTIGGILNSTFKEINDSELLLDFLQNVDAAVLNEAAQNHYSTVVRPWTSIAVQQLVWAPVIEVKNPTAFITKKMYGLLEAGNFLSVPVMMGFTSEECIQNINEPDGLKNILTVLDQQLEYLVPDDMLIVDSENRTNMGTKIRNIYTNKDLADDLAAGVKYCSDNRVTRSMIKHAEFLSKVVPTYFYQFSYAGVIGGSTHYPGLGSVGHTGELNYLFCSGTSCNNDSFPEKDLLTRQRLVKLWTNFAKYGNPTPLATEVLQNVTWPRLDIEEGDFLYLDIGENLEVRKNPREDSYKSWTKLYGSLGFDDFDTY